MTPFDKVSAGIVQYVVGEVIPRMAGENPFLTGMLGHIVEDRGPAMMKPMLLENPMLRAAGIVDEKGGVDLDLLYEARKSPWRRTRNSFWISRCGRPGSRPPTSRNLTSSVGARGT